MGLCCMVWINPSTYSVALFQNPANKILAVYGLHRQLSHFEHFTKVATLCVVHITLLMKHTRRDSL